MKQPKKKEHLDQENINQTVMSLGVMQADSVVLEARE